MEKLVSEKQVQITISTITKLIGQLTRIKLDEIINFPILDGDLNCIVHFDQRIWVTNSAPITGNNAWDTLQSRQHLPHLTQLVLFTQIKFLFKILFA